MKARRSTELWAVGMLLEDAALHFADPGLRSLLENLPGAVETIDGQIKVSASTQGIPKLRSILDVFASAFQQAQQRSELVERMRSDLLDELFNNQLVATGYAVLPKPGRDPVQIVSAFFDDATPDWQNSALTGLGREYRSVRISDPKSVPNVVKGSQKGRPGSGAAIISAIERVASRRPDFCKLYRAEASQLIRDELGIDHNSGDGLSDKNLHRYILQKCGNKAINE